MIPGSCCNKKDSETCLIADAAEKPGCAGILEDLFKTGCAILGGIALGIAAVEVNKGCARLKKCETEKFHMNIFYNDYTHFYPFLADRHHLRAMSGEFRKER